MYDYLKPFTTIEDVEKNYFIYIERLHEEISDKQKKINKLNQIQGPNEYHKHYEIMKDIQSTKFDFRFALCKLTNLDSEYVRKLIELNNIER